MDKLLQHLADLEAKANKLPWNGINIVAERTGSEPLDETISIKIPDSEFIVAAVNAMPRLRGALEVAIRFLAIQSKEPTGWTAQCCMDEMTCILDAAAT